jgi:hypothetical protein
MRATGTIGERSYGALKNMLLHRRRCCRDMVWAMFRRILRLILMYACMFTQSCTHPLATGY